VAAKVLVLELVQQVLEAEVVLRVGLEVAQGQKVHFA
jgi:hypothetical protein